MKLHKLLPGTGETAVSVVLPWQAQGPEFGTSEPKDKVLGAPAMLAPLLHQ